jgi:hypothetical protein
MTDMHDFANNHYIHIHEKLSGNHSRIQNHIRQKVGRPPAYLEPCRQPDRHPLAAVHAAKEGNSQPSQF